MNKFTANRYLKILLLTFAFLISFVVAFASAFALINNSLDGFFGNATISILISVVIILGSLYFTGLYAFSWRHVSVIELVKVGIISILLFASNIIVSAIEQRTSIRLDFISCVFFFVLASTIICSYRIIRMIKVNFVRSRVQNKKRILIVGAGEAGTTILREINTTNMFDATCVGFIDDNKDKIGTSILGTKILGTCDEIETIAKDRNVDLIVIAIPSSSAKNLKRISNICIKTGCEVKTLPGLYQLIGGEVSFSRLRDVDVQDLLGRDPVITNLDEVMGYIEDQVVLVTGGGGSIGSELCRQIATHNPKQLIILDIYENNAYEIEQELKRKLPNLNLVTLIASIRDSVKMDDVFKTYRPDIVFHAAAHKHVPLMETSPNEAVKNNILGTYKVVKCADKYEVKKFVQISTDKAVNPTNIMGATKRVCEMIIQAFSRKSKTQFVAVRFGNVLGSNGSVIPLFKKQIAEGGPVTVTHKDIIRYFMTIPEAVSLVLQAGAYAQGGEIFVLDMGEQVRIYDLAVNLIRLSGYEPDKDIEIKITGLRPGEKLYEERLMAEEGLKKTSNERISIGQPIEMDDKKLFETLDKLYNEAYSESEYMKDLVKELVPTYKIDRRK